MELLTSKVIENSSMKLPLKSTKPGNDSKWYAIRVRSRYEKKVLHDLEKAGFTVSLPLITMEREWSDRRKKVELPLFSGYVFIKIDLEEAFYRVLQTVGVVQFVGLRGSPRPIPDRQMYWLDLILTQESVTSYSDYPHGSEVKVTHGPLIGLEGRVIQKKSQSRLIVWFDVIMMGLAVEIDQAWLKPVSFKKAAPV